MDYKTFKEKVESLDIPWSVNTHSIYCPLYMTLNDGNRMYGVGFNHIGNRELLDEIYENIIATNAKTKVFDEYIEIDGFKLIKK